MTDNTIEKKRGRVAGAGAISCGPEKYGAFAKIWNDVAAQFADQEDHKGTKEEKKAAKEAGPKAVFQNKKDNKKETVYGAMAVILTKLRAAGIANDETDPSQVRAFASKVRDFQENGKPKFVIQAFTQRLDRKAVIRAWMTSKTPVEAFEKACAAGVFGDCSEDDEDETKNKNASFRACVSQMRKKGIPLKEMGTTRAAAIDDAAFVEAWTKVQKRKGKDAKGNLVCLGTVSEVKDILVENGTIKDTVETSTLKSKFKTMKKNAEEEGTEFTLLNLKAGDGFNELMQLAKMLAEGVEVPEDSENESETEDENGDDENSEEDVDPNADVSDADDFGGIL